MWFFAPQEDRLYKAGHFWNVYPASQPRPRGRTIYKHDPNIYFPFQSSVPELPPDATRLASCSPHTTNRYQVCIESSIVSSTLSFAVPSIDLSEFPSSFWDSYVDGLNDNVSNSRLFLDSFELPDDSVDDLIDSDSMQWCKTKTIRPKALEAPAILKPTNTDTLMPRSN